MTETLNQVKGFIGNTLNSFNQSTSTVVPSKITKFDPSNRRMQPSFNNRGKNNPNIGPVDELYSEKPGFSGGKKHTSKRRKRKTNKRRMCKTNRRRMRKIMK